MRQDPWTVLEFESLLSPMPCVSLSFAAACIGESFGVSLRRLEREARHGGAYQ